MAYTVKLESIAPSGTTSEIDLLSGSYNVRRSQLDLGTTQVARTLSQFLLREGFSLSSHVHTRRQINIGLILSASSAEDLAGVIKELNIALYQARERAITRLGNKWNLIYDPGTIPVRFAIRDGTLILPPSAYNKPLWDLNRPTIEARLSLLCDPFGRGAEVTIPAQTVRNDPARTTSPFHYFDIPNTIGGDQPAEMRLLAAEGEAHTKFWAGARSADRGYGTTLLVKAGDLRDASGVNFTAAGPDASDSWSGQTRTISNTPRIGATAQSLTTSGLVRSFSSGITNSNPNKILLVAVLANDDIDVTVTNGSQALIELNNSYYGLTDRMFVFYVVNPTAGQTIRINTSSSTTRIVAVSAEFNDTNPNNPFGPTVVSHAFTPGIGISEGLLAINGANGVLYSVSKTTGAIQSVVSLGIGDWRGMTFVNDLIYAVNRTDKKLYSIDPISGAKTLIGTIDGTSSSDAVGGLAWDGTTLFAVNSQGNLYSVNTSTAARTLIRSGMGATDALTWGGDGLYSPTHANSRLNRYNTLGEFQEIIATSIQARCLAYDGNDIYAVNGSGKLISINKDTGSKTEIASLGSGTWRAMTFTDAEQGAGSIISVSDLGINPSDVIVGFVGSTLYNASLDVEPYDSESEEFRDYQGLQGQYLYCEDAPNQSMQWSISTGSYRYIYTALTLNASGPSTPGVIQTTDQSVSRGFYRVLARV